RGPDRADRAALRPGAIRLRGPDRERAIGPARAVGGAAPALSPRGLMGGAGGTPRPRIGREHPAREPLDAARIVLLNFCPRLPIVIGIAPCQPILSGDVPS